MKSAVFYGKHDVRIQDSPMPEMGRGELLVKVMACGVCGTDVHIFEGDKGAADCTPPAILGHEFSGVVEQVGEGVSEFRVGDRVCVDPNDACGACYYCRNGMAHYCEHMRGIGTTVSGGFAQYCAVPAKQAYHLADSTTFEAGAMAEPVSCCLHGIDMCEIQPGASVLVIGGGMIGLLMMQLAKLAGARLVAVSEPVAAKREMACKLGADVCIDPTSQDIASVLCQYGVKRLDTVIECAGLPATVKQAIELAGNKATVMLFGLTKPDDEIAVKPFMLFQKELTIRASFINPYTLDRAIGLINSGRLDVSSMVCRTAPLEELPNILQSPALRAMGKYIISPQA